MLRNGLKLSNQDPTIDIYKQIMESVDTYTEKECREARIDELDIMDDGSNINWRFGEDPSDCLATYKNKRLSELKDEVKDELKKGIKVV